MPGPGEGLLCLPPVPVPIVHRTCVRETGSDRGVRGAARASMVLFDVPPESLERREALPLENGRVAAHWVTCRVAERIPMQRPVLWATRSQRGLGGGFVHPVTPCSGAAVGGGGR